MAENKDKGEYITLKQAATISGYSADYIGQLIRSGKLPGKQVFSNVAWMTTEANLRQYLLSNKKEGNGAQSGRNALSVSPERLATLYTVASWVAIVLFALFFLFLGYILAVSIDHRIEQKELEKLEEMGI